MVLLAKEVASSSTGDLPYFSPKLYMNVSLPTEKHSQNCRASGITVHSYASYTTEHKP